MVEHIIVKAKIKEVAKNVSVSSDFAEALDKKVIELINQAVQRADANGRKTVMAKDI